MSTVFTQRLRELRREKGLSQKQFGDMLNIAQSTVSSWERGNSQPNLDELCVIAKYFSISADYLLGLSEY